MSKFISQLGAYNEGYADGAASRDAEVAKLRKQVTRLRDALWKIAHPIDAMRAKLREGEKLNGAMSVMLASDPSYLNGIAQEALASTEHHDRS